MADVFIILDRSNMDTEDRPEVKAVVLSSRKVLGRNPVIKHAVEGNIGDAQSFWERDGGEGQVPSDKLFGYLQTMWSGINNYGMIVSAEHAREFVKQSGGI